MTPIPNRALLALTCSLLLLGCRKQLNSPVTEVLTGINSLLNCEQLLNNEELFNEQPYLPEVSSDNYYVKEKAWNIVSPLEQRIYTWQRTLFGKGETSRDYHIAYEQIGVVNEVLQALGRITIPAKDAARRDQVEGTARFYRAQACYNMLQLFARPYDMLTASRDTGIVLLLKPSYDVRFSRATMEECYNSLIADLENAALLLRPLPDPDNHATPSQVAAWALLARVYLSMRLYPRALAYADKSLQAYPYLLDYNTCTEPRPFNEGNPEVIWQGSLSIQNSKLLMGKPGNNIFIDSSLHASYATGDLRARFFYRQTEGRYALGASYTGGLLCFGGLATDELYLIRAECLARQRQYGAARQDLSTLLAKRYLPGNNQPVLLDDPEALLQQILSERRKELPFRGLRWTDLRRLNKEYPGPSLVRRVNDMVYRLPANDLRYTFPFPDDVLANSDIVQNPR